MAGVLSGWDLMILQGKETGSGQMEIQVTYLDITFYL